MGASDERGSSDVVAAAAAQVYAVPLAEFVASRKSLAASAKADGDAAAAKEILTLRKPTVTAWAMNLVPRGDSSALADIVGLGARMRAAQSQLDTATLTSVRGERDAALTAYVASVVTAAEAHGGSLSPAARDEVRASAIAALADEGAAQALASGQLTRALSYSGFGEVDVSGAVGVTSSGSIMSVLPGGRPDVAPSGAEPDPDEDELTPEELAAAVAAARAAKAEAKAAAKARRVAQAEVDAAQAQMSQAQGELSAAEEAARSARKAVVAAQKRLDSARADLSTLPDSGG